MVLVTQRFKRVPESDRSSNSRSCLRDNKLGDPYIRCIWTIKLIVIDQKEAIDILANSRPFTQIFKDWSLVYPMARISFEPCSDDYKALILKRIFSQSPKCH